MVVVAPRCDLELVVELCLSAAVLVPPLAVEPEEGDDDETQKDDGEDEVGEPEQNGGDRR